METTKIKTAIDALRDFPDLATGRFDIRFRGLTPPLEFTAEQVSMREHEKQDLDAKLSLLATAFVLDGGELRVRFLETDDFLVHRTLVSGNRSMRITVTHYDNRGEKGVLYFGHEYHPGEIVRMNADASRTTPVRLDIRFRRKTSPVVRHVDEQLPPL